MFSKTFALDNYFMHLPEYLLDAGQVLVDSGALSVSLQDEKEGYWVMPWQEEESGEAEVAIGRKNVKAYSCDCTFFKEKKLCKHVAAALILVNKNVEEKKSRLNERKKQVAEKVPRIHIKNIVQHLSEKELRSFIVEQAAKNALLAGELKAQYAHKIEIPNADDKYFLVIKNYATALAQGKLNDLKFKKLVDYLQNLVFHGEDLCSTKNYREAALIVRGLVKYLAIVVPRYRGQEWPEISNRIHQFVEKILSEDLAPTFRKDLISKLRKIYLEEPYLILDEQYNLYRQLYRFAYSQQNIIYQDLGNYLADHQEELTALKVYFALASDEKDLREMQLLVDNYGHKIGVLRSLLKGMEENQSPQYKALLGYIANGNRGTKARNWAFDRWLLVEKNTKVKCTQLVDFIAREGRIDLLSTLKSESGNRWPQYYNAVVNLIRNTGNKDLLLSVLVFNHEDQKIKDLLKSEGNTQLLLQHAPYLSSFDQEFLQQKLEDHIR
ncbi:MAG: SWIM zinc finger family protein, partial [Saprospiraceae bacterium]|nr:SWIM zinc finger family protein [Saprospiraceae bacterium]